MIFIGQVLEPERHQMMKGNHLEHNSIQRTESPGFSEINLEIDEVDRGSPKSPHANVKSVLVKGNGHFQRLKV